MNVRVMRIALVSLPWALGCAPSGPPVKPRATSPSSVRAKPDNAQHPAPRASCAGHGPLAGDVLPATEGEGLCSQIRGLLEARLVDGTKTKVTGCSLATSVQERVALSVLTVTGEFGEEAAEGSYLATKVDGGYCLVDELAAMEWLHGGHFETDFAFAWPAAHQLQVTAHRLKRIPRESTDPDSTDVDWESCDRIAYVWRPGEVKRTEAVRSDGPCAP